MKSHFVVVLATQILLFFTLSFVSCTGQNHDPELMTPDKDNAGMIHGYNYTVLGALVAYPWEYMLSESDSTKLPPVNNAEDRGHFKKVFFAAGSCHRR